MGYTGKGIKIANMENGNPDAWNLKGKVLDPFDMARNEINNHGDKVMDVLLQVAPDSKIHMLSSSGGDLPNGGFKGDFTDISLPYIDANSIHLVNASLTGTDNKALAARIEQSKDKGVIFCTSAGNEPNLDSFGYANGWITVSASHINKNGYISIYGYSSRGMSIDFTCFSGLNINSQKEKGYTMREIGTSFASPLLCGMLALVQQFFLEKAGQTLNQSEMYKFMQDNINDLGEIGRDDLYGHGIFVLPNPTDVDVDKYIQIKGDASMEFKDVKEKNWHYKAIKWITSKGTMQGYDDNTFKPNSPLTRAEYAQIKYNEHLEGK